MNEVKVQGSEKSLKEEATPQEGDELTKAMIAQIDKNEKAIRKNEVTIAEIKAEVGKLPDQAVMQQILRDLEKMEKDQGDVDKAFKEIAYTFLLNYKQDSKQAVAADKLTNALNEHSKEMHEHKQLFERPLEKSVHYTHFLGKPLWALGGMMVIICTMAYFWNRTSVKADQHERNDVQWRYMMLTPDSIVLHALCRAKEIYRSDPEEIRKYVTGEEDRRAELFAKWLRQDQTNKEIEELKKKEKHLPAK